MRVWWLSVGQFDWGFRFDRWHQLAVPGQTYSCIKRTHIRRAPEHMQHGEAWTRSGWQEVLPSSL